jgi:ATP-dependent Zn protease
MNKIIYTKKIQRIESDELVNISFKYEFAEGEHEIKAQTKFLGDRIYKVESFSITAKKSDPDNSMLFIGIIIVVVVIIILIIFFIFFKLRKKPFADNMDFHDHRIQSQSPQQKLPHPSPQQPSKQQQPSEQTTEFDKNGVVNE